MATSWNDFENYCGVVRGSGAVTVRADQPRLGDHAIPPTHAGFGAVKGYARAEIYCMTLLHRSSQGIVMR